MTPELSIVIPALNEEKTIGRFVAWCFEGIRRADVDAEILIIDSSTDDTPKIAQQSGARVVRVPALGLGHAYQSALPHIRGKYVLMGDCDCTYDFRELGPFLEKLRAGYEFVMGSRFLGSAERGSMPILHRYFGIPVTTWILNRVYGSRFSDIHCGMRAISLAALERMELRSESWEYASEMVLKSVHMRLLTAEVGVRFLKNPEGRQSHHRRLGWWSPWHAGWINLRATLVGGTTFFLIRPGLAFLVPGLALVLGLSTGPRTIGPVTFSLYWMLLGLCWSLLGVSLLYLGILGDTFFDYDGSRTKRWLKVFPYTRSVVGSAGAFVLGVFLAAPLAVEYLAQHLSLPQSHPPAASYPAVTGLFMMVTGFLSFNFTLLLHAASLSVGRRPSCPA